MALIIDLANDTSFYDSVRRLLGGVDDSILPDEDISDSAVLDLAELQVIDLVPKYETVSNADKAKLRLATIYIIASLLCPSMAGRVDIEVRTIEVTWKRKAIDYDELAESLMAKAFSLLDGLVDVAGNNGSVFAIAPSKRAVREKYE